MTCKDTEKQTALFNHIKNHTCLTCHKCQQRLVCEDEALPFGSALLTTWHCSICHQEKMYLVQDDGQLLEFDS